MKYSHVEWSPELRDFVPVKKRPKTWSVPDNLFVAILLFIGLVLFVNFMHSVPDAAQIAAAQMQGAP